MPRIKDQAICIRHVDWSETSQVVTLLTEQHGKISGVAKGSKRMSPSHVARFSGGIELLTLGQVVATLKSTVELASITEWDLQQTHRYLRQDLVDHQMGLYGADLAAALLADSDPHPASFAALRDFLVELGKSYGRATAVLRYQWRMLDDCGYRPELAKDVRIGQPLADAASYLFDAQGGGFTADAQAAEGPAETGPWRCRRQSLEILRRMAADDSDPLRAIAPADIERANRLLCVYARAILDRQLPTMTFMLDFPHQSEPGRPRPGPA